MTLSCQRWIARSIHWSARLIGTLVAAVFLMFLFGEGLGPRGVYTLNPLVLSASDFVVLSLRFLACVGLLLAWRWEALGGGIAIVCIVLATMLRPWILVAVLAMSIPAGSYLLSSFLRRQPRPLSAH